MSLWGWASSVFRGAWNGMRSLLTDPISTAKRVLDGLIGGIKSGFSGMANAIRDTMNRIRAWTAQPINFVINTVYNNGLRNFLNEILKMGGMTQLGPLKSISGYQSGGYVDLPWSASNRDPYLGVTPGGQARMSSMIIRCWSSTSTTEHVTCSPTAKARAHSAAR